MSEPENLTIRMLREIRAEIEAGFARMDARFGAMEGRLGSVTDDLNVTTSLALRATGERIAWNTLRADLRKLAERVAALEAGRGP